MNGIQTLPLTGTAYDQMLLHCSCGFRRKLARSADLTLSHVSRPSRTTLMAISVPAGPTFQTLR